MPLQWSAPGLITVRVLPSPGRGLGDHKGVPALRFGVLQNPRAQNLVEIEYRRIRRPGTRNGDSRHRHHRVCSISNRRKPAVPRFLSVLRLAGRSPRRYPAAAAGDFVSIAFSIAFCSFICLSIKKFSQKNSYRHAPHQLGPENIQIHHLVVKEN